MRPHAVHNSNLVLKMIACAAAGALVAGLVQPITPNPYRTITEMLLFSALIFAAVSGAGYILRLMK